MGYEIFLPLINKKNGTTKDIVISILSKEFPLTLKKIFFKIKKEYQHNITYQALHKALNQLLSNNIIIKKGKEYELNMTWVKEINQFIKIIQNTYSNEKGELINNVINVNTDGPITELSFNNLGDLDKYFMILNSNYLSKLDINSSICGEIRHTWWPLINTRQEYENTKEHKNYSKIRYICSGNTKIDEWVSDYYNKVGVLNIINVDCAQNYDMWIYGDDILQTILPNELNKIIDNYFNVDSLSDFNVDSFLREVFDSKFEVKVIINKNPFMAKYLKNKILSNFNEEKK